MLSWLRSRTLVLAGVFVLAALSLRPFPPAERAAEILFLPATWAREILRPLGWLSVHEVRAALDEADGALPAERDAARALLAAQIEAALPSDPELRAGRAFLVAEVLERDALDADLLRVRFPRGAGVAPDMPVVCGDDYVGRVREVDAQHPGEGIVQLVTDERLRVGAAVFDDRVSDGRALDGRALDGSVLDGSVLDGNDGPVQLVVGGLVGARARRKGVLSLGARFENRPVQGGAVVVHEVGEGARAERRARADGFRLGELRVLSDRGRPILGVDTSFDYAHGLSAVAIVGGPELATDGLLLADDAFDESLWATARAALAGDSSATRRTRHLLLPAGARADIGAAVGLGARFFGRVVRIDGRRAVAALLGDPLLTFSAVAVGDVAIDADTARNDLALRTRNLGRLQSLGLDSDGTVLVAWRARSGESASLTGPVRVATSSGDRGVPAGLWVGSCTLPAGEGEHVLRIAPIQDPSELLRMRVRLGSTHFEDLP